MSKSQIVGLLAPSVTLFFLSCKLVQPHRVGAERDTHQTGSGVEGVSERTGLSLYIIIVLLFGLTGLENEIVWENWDLEDHRFCLSGASWSCSQKWHLPEQTLTHGAQLGKAPCLSSPPTTASNGQSQWSSR